MAHFHQLIDEKKWTLLFHELDHLLSKKESQEDHELIISIFESIDESYRLDHAQKYYFEMWKIAFKAGKIKLAKSYAETSLDYLIEYRRVPAIKKMAAEFEEYGLLRSHKKLQYIDLILGKKTNFSLESAGFYEAHPELWKNSKEALKEHLEMDKAWSLSDWKLAYEYVLKFHYDKNIFLLLAEKAVELGKNEHAKSFLDFLRAKKVNLKSFEKTKLEEKVTNKDAPLNVDYDQLAMDVMSGAVEPSITEQKKILISIQDISDEELLAKGKDMIVAFGLLGMDKVVVKLCDKIIPLIDKGEVKERAGIKYMLVQSLFNNNEFYKVIDLVDDTLGEEPLLAEEIIAFEYLKADSFFRLGKYKLAKAVFVKVKKQNPHYRLVGERLRNIEEIK